LNASEPSECQNQVILDGELVGHVERTELGVDANELLASRAFRGTRLRACAGPKHGRVEVTSMVARLVATVRT
jgi:hypothetical protein